MIHRRQRQREFFQMSNSAVRDTGLSLQAKGLLALMMSFPADWKLSVEALARNSSSKLGTVRSAAQELEARGYLVRGQRVDEKGRVQGVDWVVDDEPMTVDVVFAEFGLRPLPYQGREGRTNVSDQGEIQTSENQSLENQSLENQSLVFRNSGDCSITNTVLQTVVDDVDGDVVGDLGASETPDRHPPSGLEVQNSPALDEPVNRPGIEASQPGGEQTPAPPAAPQPPPEPLRLRELANLLEGTARSRWWLVFNRPDTKSAAENVLRAGNTVWYTILRFVDRYGGDLATVTLEVSRDLERVGAERVVAAFEATMIGAQRSQGVFKYYRKALEAEPEPRPEESKTTVPDGVLEPGEYRTTKGRTVRVLEVRDGAAWLEGMENPVVLGRTQGWKRIGGAA